MKDNNTLAEKIGNKAEDFSTQITKMYSDDIGYVKLLGTIGSILPIILAVFDGTVGLIAMALSFILVLLAMKKIDTISQYTKSFKYMIISFISFIIFSLVYIVFLSAFVSGWNYSLENLFSNYIISFIVALLATIVSTYFYYKSYIELSKATNLKIFKIAAILMIVSIFVNFISETFSTILIIISTVFIIIGWFGIKTITTNKIENSTDELKEEE